jgi:serine/threonine protein kinase
VTEELLGKGSYGVVIVAEWMGVKVAAKRVHDVLLPDNLEMNTVKKKAEDEAKLLQDLRHPNLIQCFGRYYDDRGRLCIVMELMHQSLADLLKRTAGPLSPEKVNDIGSEISSALRYLHSMNVSHRDITPNNILLTASGRAKLSDLGGAKHILHVHSPIYATRQPGTPIYMPPEALDGSKYAPCLVDVYSLGVVVLEMSSGENPKPVPQNPYRPCDVSSYNGTQTFYRVPEEERRSKCFEKIDVANPIRAIVLECLKHNPNERPLAKQIQEWFLQMKDNQVLTIPTHCPHQVESHYDDTVATSKSGIASDVKKDHPYVNWQPRTGPAVPPKSAKAKLEGKRLSGLNEACSQSDHESRYQALKDQPMPKSNPSNECGYEPLKMCLDESKPDHDAHLSERNPSPKIHPGRVPRTYHGQPQPRIPFRERAYSFVSNSGVKPPQPRIKHTTTKEISPGPPIHPRSRATPSPPPLKTPPQEYQGEEYLSPEEIKPPLPPRPRLVTRNSGDMNCSSEEGVDGRGHVYESISDRPPSVLRANKNCKKTGLLGKKSSSLSVSENELLVTENKDAGSKLLVRSTKGSTGIVHEDQVTTVDPVGVHHIQGGPQGILHRILTSNKRQSLQTGIRAGKIQIMHTGLSHGSTDTLLNIGSNEIVATESNRNPYFHFDLSKNRLIQLEGYRLQCSGLGTYGRPQEWEVHVSLDGKAWMPVAHDTWETDSQTTCYWCCSSQSLAIGRFVKIIQIGQNKKGNNKFCLSGIEFYGKLYSSVAEEIKSE